MSQGPAGPPGTADSESDPWQGFTAAAAQRSGPWTGADSGGLEAGLDHIKRPLSQSLRRLAGRVPLAVLRPDSEHRRPEAPL
jgi:hypothetical protein